MLILASQTLPAQANLPDDAEDDVPGAYVILTPTPRWGHLTVRIYSYNLPEIELGEIRQAGLPCDWRTHYEHEDSLEGVCRNYLHSDGASVQGTLTLAPLAAVLMKAGAKHISLELDPGGQTIAEAPRGWSVVRDSSAKNSSGVKVVKYRFFSSAERGLPDAVPLRIGTPWSPSRLIFSFGLTLFGPALLSFWLRKRAERQGAVEAASIWIHAATGQLVPASRPVSGVPSPACLLFVALP